MQNSRRGMLLRFLRGSRRWFALAILLGLLQSLCAMLNPRIIQYTVDGILGAAEEEVPAWLLRLGGLELLRENLWLIAAVVLALALLSSLFQYGFVFFNAKGGECFVCHMRRALFAQLQALPYSWHSSQQTGDLLQRCTVDVELVKSFLTEQLLNLINCVITLVAAMVFMLRVNVPLSLVVLALQPLLLFYSVYFRAKIAGEFRRCDENEGVLSGIAQENLTGVRVVRAFGQERHERTRFDVQARIVRDSWVRLCRSLSLFWGGVGMVSGLQRLLIVCVGTAMVVRGSLTVGAFLAMLSYASLAASPVRQLGRIISDMSKAGVSITRLHEIMSARPEQDPPDARETPLAGDIVFENVSFAHAGGAPLLKNINLCIPEGTSLGILGGTGSGKSTLVQLLNRLYELEPGCGRILIGGTDIATLRRDWLRSHIGMVLQEPMLFSSSLAENLALGREDATREELEEAVRLACLDTAIAGFARGYDTVVGERGVTLSGGQKQRAAIARMLLQKTPIMVFDDSLSAVDAQTDSKIRAALRTQRQGRSCILVSHRISTLMDADQIIVLDEGRILQHGTHSELLAQEGPYRRIYLLQQEEEVPAHA